MPEQKSHGFPYVEPERHDELSAAVAAPAQAEAGLERRPNGTIAKGARTTPSKGGKSHKGTTRLSHRIQSTGLGTYAKQARFFRKAACTEIAQTVGGGYCGVLESALVKLAAQSMALAEKALDEGDVDTHRKLGESARMHLVYAREMAAKNAQARPRAPVDPLAQWRLPENKEAPK